MPKDLPPGLEYSMIPGNRPFDVDASPLPRGIIDYSNSRRNARGTRLALTDAMNKKNATKCPKCGSDDIRQQSNYGKKMPYAQCFGCNNVWAFDKGPAFMGDVRPGYGWPV